MDDNYIRERISQLRTQQNISEYKMSLDLGHSKSYIQSISSGSSLPSMSEFLYICEYLGVTPKDFFDTELKEPAILQQLYKIAENLPAEDIEILITVARRLSKNNAQKTAT